ncbi:pentatricopeptide repeat-containing protein At5g25630-like [Coffea arabica]|uniref:Pentatricopeptide repeat-containing protein At5g25630-like n=1 Tax=Coffea arabica TaxID=13443 RepID=A0A6P6T4H8_COFAR|nr:putative pentatricopeptide repeat-containing protein At1g12700, mitochondrial [Coffea arabica]XP_027073183.1 putative pentatricopeptide repeat-containing protein At1g12700, mitochondrial [Coffea arabica]XP_027073184.1 putative pentatricopeptide repeat-containing protein At1g12700, mitochondrial [Coffea arabica]XP_027073185.1 putative pentatricopeptide repeat-containing protein At1g12700, mitochondrial [Coffea arabica]
MGMMMMKTTTMKRRASSAVIVSIARSQEAAASLGTPAPAGCTTLASFLSAFPNHKPHLAFYSAISIKFKSSSEKALKFQPELRNDINNVNSLDDALSLFERMARMRPLPSVIDFTQLLDRIVKMEKHYSSVVSLFRDMCVQGIPVDEATLNIMINCCCVVGRVDLAFSTLSGFFKRGFVPNVVTFSTLLKGLFRDHKVPEAQELFKKIIKEKLCKPNETMLGIVIDGLCKAGNTQTAIDLLRAMEKRGRPCKPTAIIYNTVIDSLCKDKMVDEGLALLQDIPPNVVTYSCLIHGLCNLSRWEDVDKLFYEMKVYKIVPDVISFNIVVDALCKEGHIEDAEEVVRIMIQQGQNPNLVTYTSLMDGYCLQRRIDDTRRVFDTMVASGFTPNLHSYGILINAYYKTKKLEAAMKLFREIPHKGLTLDIVLYNTVAGVI